MKKFDIDVELIIRASDIEMFILEITVCLSASDIEIASESMFELLQDSDSILMLFGNKIDGEILELFEKGNYQIKCEVK